MCLVPWSIKRSQFIDKSVEVRNMFDWAAPTKILHDLKMYCSDFFGSMHWELGGDIPDIQCLGHSCQAYLELSKVDQNLSAAASVIHWCDLCQDRYSGEIWKVLQGSQD